MPVSIEIDLTGRDVIADLLAALEPQEIADANAVAGAATRDFLREFHRAKVGDRSWTNPDLPTHGPGRKRTRWGEDVAKAWQLTESSSEGFSVVNDAVGLRQKVDGGTIRMRDKLLTIPLVPIAHGVRARDFAKKLFFWMSPRGNKFLAYAEEGKLNFAYILKREVKQNPWPDALPTDELIADAAAEAFIEAALPEDLAAE